MKVEYATIGTSSLILDETMGSWRGIMGSWRGKGQVAVVNYQKQGHNLHHGQQKTDNMVV